MNKARQHLFTNQKPAARLIKILLPVVYLLLAWDSVSSQTKDSAAVLKTIQIDAPKRQNTFTLLTPVQSLNKEILQELNTQSAGDAARYFSGVLIKDYGGIGGLKTISVRSLGAASTGIVYDGIPVSDLQTGQIDLSRYSTTFIQSMELQQGAFQLVLSPAKTNAAAAALAIITNTFDSKNFQQQKWQAGIKAGSFNTWQPFAGIYQPLKKNVIISINAEALYSKGNYPVQINNGNYSVATDRANADIKSLEGEANLLKQFTDSSTLQVKTGVYSSVRGLPGAIVFFNNRSVQRLWNSDVFTQARYQKKINEVTSVLASAKYSHSFTRYTDPDYLNNQGGLNNRYTQQEWYISFAGSHAIQKQLMLTAASDIALNTLGANLNNFATPRRTSYWENAALHYTRTLWQLHTSLLYTGISDKTNTGAAATGKDKWTPAVALSLQPSARSPFMFRFFYKTVFRMPTFNDLYYNFIGNAALRPEFSRQYNTGITYSKQFTHHIKKISISADAYYNEVKDKIIAVPNQNLFVWTILNLGKVSIKGIDINTELSGNLFPAVTWFGRIAYTYQQAIDISDKNNSSWHNRIPYTPDHSGSALLSAGYKKWNAGYSVLFSGTRYTLGENNPYNQLSGWLTHDLFVSQRMQWKRFNTYIKASLSNIFDERFDVVRYFPMPGRSFTISLLFNNL